MPRLALIMAATSRSARSPFFTVLPGFHGITPSQRGSLSHRKLEAFTAGDDRRLYDALPSDTTFNGPYISSSTELEEAIAAGVFGWNDQDGSAFPLTGNENEDDRRGL